MTVTYNFDGGNMGLGGMIFTLIILVVMLVATWRVFEKGGEHGWAIFIPFYGGYCQFRMLWGCGWLFLLGFIPIVNIIVMIMTYQKLAKAFGKGIGFMLGLIFLPVIFIPILGFSDAGYIKPY